MKELAKSCTLEDVNGFSDLYKGMMTTAIRWSKMPQKEIKEENHKIDKNEERKKKKSKRHSLPSPVNPFTLLNNSIKKRKTRSRRNSIN